MEYIEKPREVEALQYLPENIKAFLAFLDGPDASKSSWLHAGSPKILHITRPGCDFTIQENEWLIKDLKGNYEVISDDLFHKLYRMKNEKTYV